MVSTQNFALFHCLLPASIGYHYSSLAGSSFWTFISRHCGLGLQVYPIVLVLLQYNKLPQSIVTFRNNHIFVLRVMCIECSLVLGMSLETAVICVLNWTGMLKMAHLHGWQWVLTVNYVVIWMFQMGCLYFFSMWEFHLPWTFIEWYLVSKREKVTLASPLKACVCHLRISHLLYSFVQS
jgi:hypothetical protein